MTLRDRVRAFVLTWDSDDEWMTDEIADRVRADREDITEVMWGLEAEGLVTVKKTGRYNFYRRKG